MRKLIAPFFICLSVFANDPLSSLQWALQNNGQPIFRSTGELTRDFIPGLKGEDLGIPKDYQATDKTVIVAVIDSGVDFEHPDLKDNIWENPKCKDLNAEERAKEACHGWNFLDGNSDITDDVGHGTHVAGIIAAVEGNGKGIRGAASKNVKIMPLKILNSKVKSFVYEKKVITNIIADAIAFAISNGAQVINLSLGWPKLIHTKKVRFAINKAIEKNIPIIVASGNNNKKVPVYPCSYNEVICVGAMDNNGRIPEFSNFGGKVDIVAPGEGIISTYPRNMESRLLRIPGYEIKKGSSQAAPFVSALVALLKSQNQEISIDEIKYRIFKSATSLRDKKQAKFGKINFKKMLDVSLEGDFPKFNFKNLTEVVVSEEGKYRLSLPVRALMKDIAAIDVKVSLTDGEKIISTKVFKDLKILQRKERTLGISGQISDFSISSHLSLIVEYNGKRLDHEVAFVRQIEKVANKLVFKPKVKASHILVLNRGRKISKLRKVVANKFTQDSLDYFYELEKSEDESRIQIVSLIGDKTLETVIKLTKVEKVINVVKNDFNFDGKADYMIYSLGKDKLNLVLSFFNKDGSALFGDKSDWFLEISDFEGLPFFNGEVKFEYLKVHSKELGDVKVPLFMKTWKMPELDNTLDPLDRIHELAASKKPYYLLPTVSEGRVSLTIRTLASFDFMSEFRERYDIKDRDALFFDTIITQTTAEASKGQFSAVMISGREFNKLYYKINFYSNTEFELEELNFSGYGLESNKTMTSMNEASSFRASFALNDRQNLRTIFWNDEGQREVMNFKTSTWGDLLFDVFNFTDVDDEKLLFVESRYYIYTVNGLGDSVKLPINRESSFPGVNFSETFKSVQVSDNDSLRPALLVDSSLIYGDRLYAMVYDEGKFSAPVYASYVVPKNCKYIDSVTFKKKSTIVLACLGRTGSASLELVNLEKRVK
ncbi:hypothetical protein A9Q84_12550 [Halobacteriovorax marinus]|uniref:Peptidase S8/S53 domain-containing protein n=1 Tax=Halobacteriovorax marinus TaxID=97084 RepID=A0A1Y5FE35_9BACT|nr:hypothetical protein A9Q84_12550 [Halobacteriovorax marinus]